MPVGGSRRQGSRIRGDVDGYKHFAASKRAVCLRKGKMPARVAEGTGGWLEGCGGNSRNVGYAIVQRPHWPGHARI